MFSIYRYEDGIAFIKNSNPDDELAFYNKYTKILSYYDNSIFATEIDYDTLIYITSEIIKYEEEVENGKLDIDE